MVIICVKNGVLLLFDHSRVSIFVNSEHVFALIDCFGHLVSQTATLLSIYAPFENLSEPKDRKLTEILSRISRCANDSQIRSGGIQ